jgi:N-acyl-D-amino-acid deacylase
MKSLLRAALEEGAVGATAGMSYDPNRFASYEEVLALAAICAEYGRAYQFHAPYCPNADAARYSLRLARDSKVRLSIAHFQAPPKYRHEAEEMLAIVSRARDEGVDITFNVMQDSHMVYSAKGWKSIFLWVANTYGGRSWTAEGFDRGRDGPRVPQRSGGAHEAEYRAGGRYPSGLSGMASECESGPHGHGRARGVDDRRPRHEHGAEPEEFAYSLICGQSGLVPEGQDPILSLSFAGTEEFIGEATLHEAGMPSTDLNANESVPGLAEMTPWRGAYNTMPKFFRESRRRGTGLEETVRHMTSLAASSANLFDRGLLREGLKADLAIFDGADFAPLATYANLTVPAAGMKWVFVSGTPIIEEGAQNGNLPGRMISLG